MSLYNKEFLNALDKQKIHITLARITALNERDLPVEKIEGRITQGSLNIDSKSTMQRSCSLTMVATDVQINDYYWGVKTKIKLEVGILNRTNLGETDMVWFPQGVFILNNFNTTQDVKNYMIELQGQDKMCKLNGTISGAIPHSLTLDSIVEEQTDGTTITKKVPLRTLITQLIKVYGEEELHNIIIKNLDDTSLELISYEGAETTYLIYEFNKKQIIGETTNTFPESTVFYDIQKTPEENEKVSPTKFVWDDNLKFTINENGIYYIIKVEPADYLGYRQIETHYPAELVANPGETVTTILDKIVQTFGQYRYYYNLEGQFVFEKKQEYVLSGWNKETLFAQGLSISPMSEDSEVIYNFSDNEMSINIKNNPIISNIKNDFSIQGKTKGVANSKGQVIRMRYAIDKKPTQYIAYEPTRKFATNAKVNDNLKEEEFFRIVDWREIIYQMAKDYSLYNQNMDFYQVIEKNNPDFIRGITGYENYYTDILGFWRTLYFPRDTATEDLAELPIGASKDDYYKGSEENAFWTKAPVDDYVFWFDFLEPTGSFANQSVRVIGSKRAVVSDDNISKIFAPKIPDVIWLNPGEKLNLENSGKLFVYLNPNGSEIEEFKSLQSIINYITNKHNEDGSINESLYGKMVTINSNLSKEIEPNKVPPSIAILWENKLIEATEREDFINSSPTALQGTLWEIANPKNIKDVDLSAVISPYILVGETTGGFFEGEMVKSYLPTATQDKLNELLYNHSYFSNSVSLTTVPIYYLQPNKKIGLQSKDAKINGLYTLDKITLPLIYNGTMSITAIEVPDPLY